MIRHVTWHVCVSTPFRYGTLRCGRPIGRHAEGGARDHNRHGAGHGYGSRAAARGDERELSFVVCFTYACADMQVHLHVMSELQTAIESKKEVLFVLLLRALSLSVSLSSPHSLLVCTSLTGVTCHRVRRDLGSVPNPAKTLCFVSRSRCIVRTWPTLQSPFFSTLNGELCVRPPLLSLSLSLSLRMCVLCVADGCVGV